MGSYCIGCLITIIVCVQMWKKYFPEVNRKPPDQRAEETGAGDVHAHRPADHAAPISWGHITECVCVCVSVCVRVRACTRVIQLHFFTHLRGPTTFL